MSHEALKKIVKNRDNRNNQDRGVTTCYKAFKEWMLKS